MNSAQLLFLHANIRPGDKLELRLKRGTEFDKGFDTYAKAPTRKGFDRDPATLDDSPSGDITKGFLEDYDNERVCITPAWSEERNKPLPGVEQFYVTYRAISSFTHERRETQSQFRP